MGRPRKKKPPNEKAIERMYHNALADLAAAEDLDQTLVKTQIEVAAIHSRIWRAKELYELIVTGNDLAAQEACEKALKWETQKTRAQRESIADRVTALEGQVGRKTKLKARLELLDGGQAETG